MSAENIDTIFESQNTFFRSGATRHISFRKEALKKLHKAIRSSEDDLFCALTSDLGKSRIDSFTSEIGLVELEINYALKHMHSWARKRKVGVPFGILPATASIHSEPYGTALIMGPWNYPFQLLFSPLVGAIAAGNCATLKPSEYATHTATVITRLIRDTFEPQYITSIEGDKDTAQKLLTRKWDYLFFTGGTAIGRKVMRAAAEHLIPLTLELGGKSPCVVDKSTNIKATARRIIWGKFINAGQTCVAPDYLLVHERIVEPLIQNLKTTVGSFFGADPKQCRDYGHIINHTHFDRLVSLLENQDIIFGGKHDRQNLYISPTIVRVDSWESSLMHDEIFGPILPVLTYSTINDAILTINSRPKPLALYLFSHDENIKNMIIENTSSGGVCINDTINHIVPHKLPFGGVGNSGMGQYHGEASFETFSHRKSVLSKSFLLDMRFRYPPYRFPLWLARMIMRLMTR